ncbi:MAG TPA: sialidase family protein, partial [Tepidisphaeraceae bacterium]|nr:sialidase family protein [Tepidisphaeraceae bacterium]
MMSFLTPRRVYHSVGNLIQAAGQFLMAGCVLVCGAAAPAANTSEGMPKHDRLAVEHHLTLAPKAANSRNSEGDFIQLKDGRWLFVYTNFTGGADDHSKAFLAARESSDGGKTWSEKDRVVVANEGGFNVMSVSLLRLKSGEIALFYLRKNSLRDCRPVMRVSRDEAESWSDPVECITDEVGYYVLNNNRVIQLGSGRLVMPTALHDYVQGKLQPGKIVVYLSDDLGKTWRRSKTILEKDAKGTRVNLMEPGVVEASAGRMLMVIRTKLGCQYLSESAD